jgi:hypothetical protein
MELGKDIKVHYLQKSLAWFFNTKLVGAGFVKHNFPFRGVRELQQILGHFGKLLGIL